MSNEISILISAVSVLVALLGGFVSVLQFRDTQKMERANRINELIDQMRSNDAINNTLYLIDYNIIWYSKDFHSGNELESQIDRTFSFFSYICYLRKSHVLKEDEFVFFEYHLNRILRDKCAVDYLYNIFHFSNHLGVKCSFSYLCDYGKEKHLLDESFYDSNSWKLFKNKYSHNLNF